MIYFFRIAMLLSPMTGIKIARLQRKNYMGKKWEVHKFYSKINNFPFLTRAQAKYRVVQEIWKVNS